MTCEGKSCDGCECSNGETYDKLLELIGADNKDLLDLFLYETIPYGAYLYAGAIKDYLDGKKDKPPHSSNEKINEVTAQIEQLKLAC